MIRKLTLLAAISAFVFGSELQTLTIPLQSYKIQKLSKSIKGIKVSDAAKLNVKAVKEPSQESYNSIELFGKAIGQGQILVEFSDGSYEQLEINVVKNIEPLREWAKKNFPDIAILQRENKLILQGDFESTKAKETLFAALSQADFNTTKEVIDLSVAKRPPSMVRLKLYAVELSTSIGHEYKSGLLVSAVSSKQGQQLNTNPNPNPLPAIAGIFDQAVTLSGGLTAIAGILGSNFNLEATLSFLKSNNMATILDETAISTLENKDAKFHAGGTIYLTTQTVSQSGTVNSNIIPVNYGIVLTAKASTIMDGGFVNMSIHTESSKIDRTNTINSIPGMLTKQVDTNVVAKNKSVIVLGGMINSEDTKASTKIPLLGDLPIIGHLFKSESFIKGQSELAFFIVPEVIEVDKINDMNFLQESVKDKKDFEEKALPKGRADS